MPESVEAARNELWDAINAEARWIQAHGEGNIAMRTRIVEMIEKEYPAAIRAEERTRLLNPSDELVEAVAMAMVAISPLRQWRTDRSWGAAGDSVHDSYRVLARAALQAAGSALDSGSAG